MEELGKPPNTTFEKTGEVPMDWKLWFDQIFRKVNDGVASISSLDARVAKLEEDYVALEVRVALLETPVS